MSTIAPFRALRYDAAPVGDLGHVLAPPYDVISAEEAEALRDQHPCNIVRITLPEGAGADRYELAARRLESWVADGTLVREPQPALFVHRHYFTSGGAARARTGLWALVRLVPLDAGVVLPHERTMRAPKADRLSLMRACRAQLSPIFFICSDSAGLIGSRLNSWADGEPSERAEFPAGERHELWRVGSGAEVDRLSSSMSKEVLLIADGHHRYETALAYRDGLLSAGAVASGRGPHEFVLAYVVSERDPGLLLRPTHRVVTGLADVDWTAVLSRLELRFNIQRLDESEAATPESVVDREAGTPSFVLVLRNEQGGWLFRLRPSSETGARSPEAVQQLASVAFHEVFMREGLGLARELEEEHLRYVRDPVAAVREVRGGSAEAAALLAPAKVTQIREAAAAAERLPPKTTLFWPKVPTGIAMHPIDPEETIDVPGAR